MLRLYRLMEPESRSIMPTANVVVDTIARQHRAQAMHTAILAGIGIILRQ